MRRREGLLDDAGALVVRTGVYTGRSPKDKFSVREPSTADHIWWGAVNHPLSEAHFDALYRRMLDHFKGRTAYVQDLYAGADPSYRLRLRVISESAWSSLFARTLFIRPARAALGESQVDFVIVHAPDCHADPAVDGTRSDVFIVINFARRMLLIGGTATLARSRRASSA